MTDKRDQISTAMKDLQVVIFISEGVIQSVAVQTTVRPFETPCVIVDYDERHDLSGGISPEEFECVKLGCTRLELSENAVYIY